MNENDNIWDFEYIPGCDKLLSEKDISFVSLTDMRFCTPRLDTYVLVVYPLTCIKLNRGVRVDLSAKAVNF